MKSVIKRMVADISTSLLGVLYHCEAEKKAAAEAKSAAVYKKECTSAHASHQYRLKRAATDCERAVSNYRSMSRALEQVVTALLKNEFQITSASLVRTRFLVNLQRGGVDFQGVLTFSPNKEVSMTIYKDFNKPNTCVFKVKYSKHGLVSTNKMIQGLLKAIE